MLDAVTASTRYSVSMLSPGAMLIRLSSRVTYTSVLPSCVTLPAYTKGSGGALGGCGGALARATGAGGGGGAKLFGANGSLPAAAGAVRSSLARSMSEAGATTARAGGRAEVAWITSATGFRPATMLASAASTRAAAPARRAVLRFKKMRFMISPYGA